MEDRLGQAFLEHEKTSRSFESIVPDPVYGPQIRKTMACSGHQTPARPGLHSQSKGAAFSLTEEQVEDHVRILCAASASVVYHHHERAWGLTLIMCWGQVD